MIGMNYLVALPADTTQLVHVDGKRIGNESNDTVQFTLSIERDGIVYASRTIEVKMKPQESEDALLPSWTHLNDPLVPVPVLAPLPEPIVQSDSPLSAPAVSIPPLDTTGGISIVPPVPAELHSERRGRAVPLYGK